MATAKKKTARVANTPKPAAKTSWGDTIKLALAKKKQPRGWPEQSKPRDTTVQKVKKDAF